MTRSLHCFVSGRVQGVFFRGFVQEQARGLGVTGFARNLPDGRVEVLAQGPDHALEQLRSRLAQGPMLARVDSVDTAWTDHQTPYGDFQIIR
ncbi:MAG: acylphosphatase [Thermodesulfobacteriota bacterium]